MHLGAIVGVAIRSFEGMLTTQLACAKTLATAADPKL